MKKLILGCGYLGLRVARRWQAEGHAVIAATRDGQRAEQLRQMGIEPLLLDVTRPETLCGLPQADTVLYAVGYSAEGGKTRREVYVDGLRNVLAVLPPPTGKFLFISSTGVYGDAGGGWVDEETPCHPLREAGQAFVEAEQLLLAHPVGRQAVILRLAGIYGPDRVIHRRDLLAGKPIAVASDAWLNLIHVDDAVEAILAAERKAVPPRVYLVSDGHPTDRRSFARCVAARLGLGEPVFQEIPPGTTSGRHDGSSKRVANARMVRELGVALKYADFNAGVAASLADQAD